MRRARKTLGRVRGWVGGSLLLAGLGMGAWGAEGPGTGGGTAGGAMPDRTMPDGTRIFPLAEVHRGLRGTALTVFEGTKPEAMEVEILGVVRNSLGPGRDMILARLGGAKPEYTGVVAGMSGSPVYVDGRLLGALSYRIGQFSKEPIAGITPIAEMLEVGESGGAGEKPRGNGEMQAIETPLVFGGFSQAAVDRFGEGFRRLGMEPVAGLGGRDAGAAQTDPLVAGSAVSAVLVDGDLSITGTCTVTYVDAKELLACGHPLTQTGAVDMPMTKAEVVATLASPMNAFKIVNATEVVGAFREDRASAILGRFGETARMIPVEVEVVPEGAGAGLERARTYHFSVLNNRQLTPQAVMVSVFQTLQQTNVAAAETSYRVRGEIGVEAAGRPVRMEGMMTPTSFGSGAINTALFVGQSFDKLYDNAREQPVMTGVRLKIGVIGERRSVQIAGARLGAEKARAGDTVEVEVRLNPYREAARTVTIPVRLPASTPAGSVRVLVSDGATLDRLTTAHEGGVQKSADLLDTVAAINRQHANDRVYVTLLDHTAQAVLASGALPSVPISMANVLDPTGETQRLQMTGESVTEAGSVAVEDAVSGFQVLTMEVR